MRFVVDTMLLIALGAISLSFGLFLLPELWALEAVRWLTKPMFCGIYLLTFYFAVQTVRARIPETRALPYQKLAICMAATFLLGGHILLTEPTTYKVLNDEYVIAAQAKTLYQQNSFDYPESTLNSYGYVTGVDRLLDKRPPAFASALSLLHTVIGYRASNVFLFNFMIAGGFIFLTFVLFQRACPLTEPAYISQLLWLSLPLLLLLSSPLFAIVANSAGLDLFNTFLIVLSGYTGYRYLLSRCGTDGILWLLISLLLVYARYESILFVFSIGCLILWCARRETRLPLLYPLAIFIIGCIPFVLQFRVFEAFPERSLNDVPAAGVFSLSYLLPNLSVACEFFLIPSVTSLGSAFIGWLGLTAALILLVRFIIKGLPIRELNPLDVVLLAYGAVITANFCILMAYYWGQFVQYEVARLALPMHLLLAILALRVLLPLTRRSPKIIYLFVGAGSIYFLLISSPRVSADPHVYTNTYASTDQWARSVILKHSERPYVIAPRPVFWYLYDIPSASPETVRHSLSNFAYYYRSATISPFLIAEYRIDPYTQTTMPMREDQLMHFLNLEPIAEASFHANRVVRIYQITGLKVDSPTLRPGSLDHRTFLKYPVESWFMKRF